MGSSAFEPLFFGLGGSMFSMARVYTDAVNKFHVADGTVSILSNTQIVSTVLTQH
jgi:hypothetical protein